MRKAFTLIELLVATALAMFIILLAATAFRLIVNGMRTAQRLSVENGMLRAGFFVALDDADFWRSHADPAQPYDKGDLALGVANGNAFRKRIFAPVSFHARLEPDRPRLPASLTAAEVAAHPLPNLNALLPHDPRSWYRGHLWTDARPNNGIERITDLPNRDWGMSGYGAPAGITPRHLFGPYSMSANINMAEWKSTMSTLGIDPVANGTAKIEVDVQEYAPHAMWKVFQRIGQLGVLTYMPNGTAMRLQDSNGESPWWGSDPVVAGSINNHPYQVADTAIVSGDDRRQVGHCWTAVVEERLLLDAARFMGMGFDQRTHAIGLRTVIGKEVYTTSNAAVDFPYDYDEYYGGMRGNDGNNSQLGRSPQASVIPATGSGVKRGGDRSVPPEFTATTVRLPWNTTDWERRASANFLDLTSKPDDMPILKTALVRYQRVACTDVTIPTVIIENPESGKRVEIRWTMATTTLRGARQHWSAMYPGTMGDAYVDP
ncbi:MAG: hypothetical protein RLZZ127_253 [Planctomycetota bacterium]|jgi:hypothetical protein